MPSPAKTIAVDLRALVPAATGIGVYTRNLLLALAREDPGTRYLGLSQRPVQGAAELEAAGIVLEVQPAPLGVIWQQVQLPRRLLRGDVDLFWSPLMTLPLLSRLPSVVTIHDLTVLLYPETHTVKVRLSLLPFLERSLLAARRVVAVSQATAADLAAHFPECAPRVRVVYEGVEPAFTPGTAEGIAATRRELGCPAGYVLYVGTLEPRKNVDGLLTAWAARRRADPTTPPLLLAGGAGWHSGHLRARIAALAPLGARYLGRVDQDLLVRLFQAASVFAYPSLYEGFGLPVLEALACGVPTVVSDAASLPEVVGDAALIVPSGDPAALAGALARLCGTTCDASLGVTLGRRAVARAATFRWQDAARRMAEVFREALD